MKKIFAAMFVMLTMLVAACAGDAKGNKDAKGQKTTPEAPALDAKVVADLTKKLNETISKKDLTALQKESKKLGFLVLGDYEYATQIAILQAREEMLETSFSDAVAFEKEAGSQRRVVWTQLQTELDEIRKIYKDDDAGLKRQQHLTIRQYFPSLQGLKKQVDECAAMKREADVVLLQTRRERKTLERAYAARKEGQGPRLMAPLIQIPDLYKRLGVGKDEDNTIPPGETLDSALEKLKLLAPSNPGK